jgi:hypothetical protein
MVEAIDERIKRIMANLSCFVQRYRLVGDRGDNPLMYVSLSS